MQALFADVPEAISNTVVIAERCQESGIPQDGYHLPIFECPEGLDEDAYMLQLCEAGHGHSLW